MYVGLTGVALNECDLRTVIRQSNGGDNGAAGVISPIGLWHDPGASGIEIVKGDDRCLAGSAEQTGVEDHEVGLAGVGAIGCGHAERKLRRKLAGTDSG